MARVKKVELDAVCAILTDERNNHNPTLSAEEIATNIIEVLRDLRSERDAYALITKTETGQPIHWGPVDSPYEALQLTKAADALYQGQYWMRVVHLVQPSSDQQHEYETYPVASGEATTATRKALFDLANNTNIVALMKEEKGNGQQVQKG
jgi:hypothetical protein